MTVTHPTADVTITFTSLGQEGRERRHSAHVWFLNRPVTILAWGGGREVRRD